MESQFGKKDIPFYTGRLMGLRSFNVTDKGELTGVTYQGRWKDGENEAKCALTDKSFYDYEVDQSFKDRINPDPNHQVATINCSCGYYAYFDGNNNEYQHGVNVEALVEAWGRMTIGDRGFRASKARIAALVIPKDYFPQTWVGKLLHRSRCKAGFRQSHAWTEYPYTAWDAGCTLPLFPYPKLINTIINRYPSTEIFNTMEEAVAKYPLTSVEMAEEIVGAE